MATEREESLLKELEAMRQKLAVAEARNAKKGIAIKEFENTCKKIEQAHQEWISALDVVKDLILIHDEDFRILRCNLAYQQLAGMPFKNIVGQPYYEIFPKTHTPLITCQQAQESSIEEGEVKVDGKVYCARSYPVVGNQEGCRHTVLTLEDITNRKHTEDTLLGSAAFTKAILDNLPIGIAVNSIEPSLAFNYMNDNFPKLYRTTRERLNVPDAFWEAVYEDPEFRESLRSQVLTDYLSGDVERMVWRDIPISRKGAETTYISARNIPMPDKKHTISMVWDVTELKQAESALRESEEKFRALVESTSDWIWEIDHKWRYTYVSPRSESLLGYRPDELLGKSPFDLMSPEEAQRIGIALKDLIDQNLPVVELENANICKDGRQIILETSAVPVFDEKGAFSGYRGIDRDITERKHAQEMLIASHDLLQSVVENIPIRVFWKDTELRYLGCNTLFAHDAGLSTPEELIGKDDFQMAWREQAELYRSDDQQIIDSGIPKVGYEEPQTTPDGRTIWLRTSKVPLRTADDSVFGMLGIYEDVTEQKAAEVGLKRAIRALSTLSAGNSALVHAEEEQELLAEICRILVEIGDYRMAWVGVAEHDEKRSVRPIAEFGYVAGYLDRAKITWADTARGHGPTGTAIRTKTVVINQDYLNNPDMKPWRKAAIQRSYQSSIALPLVVQNRVWGALTIYATDAFAFIDDEVKLLTELAGDLAYGIETLHTRAEHEQHAVILRRSLEQSIETIAATVESRDPYTAGHQRRVSELAVAIAQAMGLPEEQIQGLHLAAIIHDLGKIHIPAEILAKPGKLSDIEFALIKTHPQAGYDILKNVKFPWPIADIVWQHHEKLDGSGYPQGLKGDEILLESKILTVADIVEAMSSHRPYRSSLGIKNALEEIKRGRGIQYDPDAVDACLKLFEDKNFKFSKN